MSRLRRFTALAALAISAMVIAACGSHGIQVAKDSPYHHGAELFAEHCAGCHTLAAAGTEGSATDKGYREKTDGPNFNQRKEEVDQVLYAIANGGFSGAIMPQNVLVGDDARAVAEFLAKYSGQDAKPQAGPTRAPATDSTAAAGQTTASGNGAGKAAHDASGRKAIAAHGGTSAHKTAASDGGAATSQ